MNQPPSDPNAPDAASVGPTPRASFGYREVPAAEKAGLVRQVFESVAPRYDLMNDLMSGGVHRLWKNALVDVVNPRAGEKFLDVAGRPGGIPFQLLPRPGRRRGGRPRITPV